MVIDGDISMLSSRWRFLRIGLGIFRADAFNRNTTLTNPLSEVTTNTYDADSRLSTRTLANGVVAGHGYDAANNLTTLTYVSSAGTTLSSFGNAYSPANMRTSVTDVAGNVTTFTYDGAYQVASQTGGGSAALGWADMTVSQWADLTVDQWASLPVDGSEIIQTNQYDNSGNALAMVTTAGTVTNSYAPANRMTSSISPLGTTTLTYDGRNRRTNIQTPDGGITTYTWTDDDQLAAIALPNGGGIVTNTYNGDGLRFSRTDANGTNSFAWNGKVLEAQLGAGNTVSTWYTQGMGEGGQRMIMRMIHRNAFWAVHQRSATKLSRGLTLGQATFNMGYYCRNLWHQHVGKKSPLHRHLPGNFLNILAWSEQVAVPIARYCKGRTAGVAHAKGS